MFMYALEGKTCPCGQAAIYVNITTYPYQRIVTNQNTHLALVTEEEKITKERFCEKCFKELVERTGIEPEIKTITKME